MTQASPADWRQRYESLRGHFLEQPRLFGSVPMGLATLMRDGLASWMHLWAETSAPRNMGPSNDQGRTPGVATPGTQLQLTLLLSQMTLSHL